MARPCEARKALGVQLQQVAWARPLEAAQLVAGRLGSAREPAPLEAARDGRVRDLERRGEQARPPAGAASGLADALVELLRRQPRLALRRRWPIAGPAPRAPLLLGRLAEAVDPVLHRRGRHAPPGGGLAAGHSLVHALLDELDALPSGQPPTLVRHPVPFLEGEFADPQPRDGAGCLIRRSEGV
jgi:hypothetical protein